MNDRETLNKIAEMTNDYRPPVKDIPFFHGLTNYDSDDRIVESQEPQSEKEPEIDQEKEDRKKRMNRFCFK